MPVVIFLAAAVILGGVVVVAMGRGGELERSRREMASRLDFQTWSDVARYRPPAALLGYHAGVTEHALAVIARTVAERDAEIDWLRRRLAETGPQLGAPRVGGGTGYEGTGYVGATTSDGTHANGADGLGADGPGGDRPGPVGPNAVGPNAVGPNADRPGPDGPGPDGPGRDGPGRDGPSAPRPREAPGKHEFLASPTVIAPDGADVAEADGAAEAVAEGPAEWAGDAADASTAEGIERGQPVAAAAIPAQPDAAGPAPETRANDQRPS